MDKLIKQYSKLSEAEKVTFLEKAHKKEDKKPKPKPKPKKKGAYNKITKEERQKAIKEREELQQSEEAYKEREKKADTKGLVPLIQVTKKYDDVGNFEFTDEPYKKYGVKGKEEDIINWALEFRDRGFKANKEDKKKFEKVLIKRFEKQGKPSNEDEIIKRYIKDTKRQKEIIKIVDKVRESEKKINTIFTKEAKEYINNFKKGKKISIEEHIKFANIQNNIQHNKTIRALRIFNKIRKKMQPNSGLFDVKYICYSALHSSEDIPLHYIIGPNGVVYSQCAVARSNTTNRKIFDYLNVFSYRGEGKPSFEKFVNMINEENEEIDPHILLYWDAVYVLTINSIDARGKVHNALKRKYADERQELCIFHRYLNYALNLDAKDFGDLFVKNKEVIKNSCLLNAIYMYFQDSFNKLSTKGTRKYKAFTIKSLCRDLNISSIDGGVSLTLDQVVEGFFKPRKIAFHVMNIYGGIIYSYEPEKRNTNIRKGVFRIIVKGDHIHVLSDNLSEFDQVKKQLMKYDEFDVMSVPNDFYLMDHEDEPEKMIVKIDKIQEIRKIILANEDKEIKFITNSNLDDILFKMINKYKYSPDVTCPNSRILKIRFKINNIIYSIEEGDITCPENYRVMIDNVETYNKYNKLSNETSDALLTTDCKSVYNPLLLEILDNIRTGPKGGFFDKYYEILFNTVDNSKAYAYCLMLINAVAVFDFFDMPELYNNEEIEPLNMYVVEIIKEFEGCLCIFDKVIDRVFGFVLMELNEVGLLKDNIKILGFVRPSNIIYETNYKKHIENMFNTQISDDKKINTKLINHIVHKFTGIMEKKFNKRTNTKTFLTPEECFFYKGTEGGKIHIIDNEEELDIDEGVEGHKDKERTREGNKIFMLIKSKKVELNSGFRTIKDQIYNVMSMILFNQYRLLKKNGIPIMGIHTDSLLVACVFEDLNKIEELNWGVIAGTQKYEEQKPLIHYKMHLKDNKKGDIFEKVKKFEGIKTVMTNKIVMKNEYNYEEFGVIISRFDNILIRGDMAGSGKTTACMQYKYDNSAFYDIDDEGNKIYYGSDIISLCICPDNRLCKGIKKDHGINAITRHKLMGELVASEQKRSGYDVKPFDAIIFDEFGKYNARDKAKIWRFKEAHPEKKFIFNEDGEFQRKPFGDNFNNIDDLAKYYKRAVDFTCGNCITLHFNKRLKDPKEQERAKQFKEDLFNMDIDPMETIKKYGYYVTKDKEEITDNVLRYFSKDKMIAPINNKIHQRHLPKEGIFNSKLGKIWKGLKLVCKSQFTEFETGNKLITNYEYEIIDIKRKLGFDKVDSDGMHIKGVMKKSLKWFVTLFDSDDDITIDINIKSIHKFMKLPYCMSVDSAQGLTFELGKKTTVMDCDIAHIDRNYIYVALTRVQQISDIIVLESSESDKQILRRSHQDLYLRLKIQGYKKQDKRAGREIIEEEYCTIYDIYNMWARQERCNGGYCGGEEFYITNNGNGREISNITLQRRINGTSHHKKNCFLMCDKCNKILSDKVVTIPKFTKSKMEKHY